MESVTNDFNHIEPWLKRKLRERHITHLPIFQQAKHYYCNDLPLVFRQVQTPPGDDEAVFDCLSTLPVYLPDGSTVLEEVSWGEGMQQYAERIAKSNASSSEQNVIKT